MGFLANINIGKRLGIGFALVLAMTAVIAAVGIARLNAVADSTRAMMASPLAKERLIADWHMQVFAAVRRTAAIVKSSDPSLVAYFKEDGAVTSKRSSELIKQIESLLSGEQEKALFKKIGQQRSVYSAARDSAIKAKADGNLEESARILHEGFEPAAKVYEASLAELVAMQRHQIDTTGVAIDAVNQASANLLYALTGVAVLIGGLVSWLLAAGIVGPIRQAVSVAETVAGGDLTRTIEATTKDETGALLRALRHMNDSLVGIVSQVRSGTDAIATASGEISDGNLDLSARTEQQASALEETAAAMEELTTTVRQNADNARQANQLSMTASEVAVQGGAVVSQVITTMGSINESSRKIVDIIGVIDGIAFQTNILALNAAVEAARAGEQGRGFAVVASEVRTLAQRSAAAAKEIKTLIGDSVEKVDAGTALVDKAGATMEQVVTSIGRVTDIMAEIASASQEQTGGIEQVNRAIGQMDDVTQQNAALVEESAAAAGAMREQAAQLAQVVDVFTLDRHAAVVAAAASTATATRPAVARHAPARAARNAPVIAAPPRKRSAPATVGNDDWETF
jgi:methyl-accepting chemotaxis protein